LSGLLSIDDNLTPLQVLGTVFSWGLKLAFFSSYLNSKLKSFQISDVIFIYPEVNHLHTYFQNRQIGLGALRENPREKRDQLDQNIGHKWKASVRPLHAREPTVLSHESRGRSGTLPSDYRYSQENVNEKSKDCSLLHLTCSEPQTLNENYSRLSQGTGEENHRTEPGLLNKKRGPAPQRPPPPKRDKYRRPDNSAPSLGASSESLLAAAGRPFPSSSPAEVFTSHAPLCQSPAVFSGKLKSDNPQELQQASSAENVCQHLEEKKYLKSESVLTSSKYRYLQK
ncbi:UNVERIFIED_CONTAM: hypothetical protein H355_015864, partial [Colinus virginianus]